MNCPIHLAVEMRPEIQQRPFLAYSTGDGTTGQAIHRARGKRVILRCTVPGCPRVDEAPEKRLPPEEAV